MPMWLVIIDKIKNEIEVCKYVHEALILYCKFGAIWCQVQSDSGSYVLGLFYMLNDISDFKML